jgi:predicted AAA+ superfamily ATPase
MEIKRSIINELYNDIDTRETSILVGARQVGKTFLLRKIESRAKKRGLRTLYFDLELPSDSIKFNTPETEIFNLLTTDVDVVLIDEFHYLKNASHIFKAIYDSKKKVKVFASGSSSLEIHKHLKESLAGRKRIHRIFPCTFSEMNSLKGGFDILPYLIYGGLPGLIHAPDTAAKKELLQDILQSYLLKDIKSLIKEENIRAFNMLLYPLAQNQGGLVSAASIAQDVGLTPMTIESYLDILSQTYVCHPVPSFSTNLGNELKKSRKCYLYDSGIRNILLKDFRAHTDRPDAGCIIENFVFHEISKQMTPEVEIRFWRTRAGDEVDFIWLKNRVPFPIEVKASDSANKMPNGMRAFLKRYPHSKQCFIVHGGKSYTETTDDIQCHFLHWHEAHKIPELVAG